MADRWEQYLDRQRALEALERRARRMPLLDCPDCAERRRRPAGSPQPADEEDT